MRDFIENLESELVNASERYWQRRAATRAVAKYIGRGGPEESNWRNARRGARQQDRSRVQSLTRLWPSTSGLRFALTAGGVTIAVAVTLVITAPWSTSPGFLARAATAITPPPGTTLYAQWESTFADPSLGVKPNTIPTGKTEEWIDSAPPHHYRYIAPIRMLESAADPELHGSTSDLEIGGTQHASPPESLIFLPANTLWSEPEELGPAATSMSGSSHIQTNPLSALQDALADGNAHNDGPTELDGQTLDRITFDIPGEGETTGTGYVQTGTAYVDPESLYPVQIDTNGTGTQTSEHVLHFEYLPATPANVALTNIRAQHPDATVASASTVEHTETTPSSETTSPQGPSSAKPSSTETPQAASGE